MAASASVSRAEAEVEEHGAQAASAKAAVDEARMEYDTVEKNRKTTKAQAGRRSDRYDMVKYGMV